VGLHRGLAWLAACGLLVALTTGCESLQRKFTRKPKHAPERPDPIISFQDYSRTITPLDRYRKHYLMFDYWNGQLMDALRREPLSAKRLRHASAEALTELRTLHALLLEVWAQRLDPLLEERAKLDRQLQSGRFTASQSGRALRVLESQARQLDRDFSWRDVQEALKPPPAAEAEPAPVGEEPS
jgi:hypothetical protein